MLYTIAEYAKLKGISRQAVYKQIENGTIEAIDISANQNDNQADRGGNHKKCLRIKVESEPANQDDNLIDGKNDNQVGKNDNQVDNALQAQIDDLRQQLAESKAQTSAWMEEAISKRKEIESLHKMLDQAQQLQAATLLQLQAPQTPAESKPDADADSDLNADAVQNEAVPEDTKPLTFAQRLKIFFTGKVN